MTFIYHHPRLHAQQQRGLVLLIALIVLVAMTLAGLALMRSVDTASLIAGNLAFQQSAASSSTAGVEAAINWLEQNNTGTTLHDGSPGEGYQSFRQDPAADQTWDVFWVAVLATQSSQSFADAAGNTISYAIQRLCNQSGSPTSPGTNCSQPPSSEGTTAGSSMQAGHTALDYSGQIYYRITVRVAGARNTVSYTQAIVAM